MTETIRVRHDDSAPDGVPAPRLKTRSKALRWWLSAAVFISVAGLCAWLGYYTTLNSFAGWDDEGNLLTTLWAFTNHGGLYTHVYSSFGPFYYEAFSTVFTWLPITLDNGRIATLIVTVIASLGFGIAITMFTRNVLAGAVTQVGTFALLILSFVYESMHPMMLVSLLLAVALVALALVARGHRSLGCTVLGAIVAALVLTVVNVGVFAAIAFVFTGLALAPPVRDMRLLQAAAAVLLVGTPFLLIIVAGGHTTESWAIKYSVIMALSAAGVVVLTLNRGNEGLVHTRDAVGFLLGGGAMTVLVAGIALASGTQPLALVRGLFIDPAHFSSAFTIPLSTPVWVEVWGAACLVGAVLYRRYRSRNSPPPLVDAIVHMGVGLLILYCVLQETQLAFTNTFTVALPLLCFAAIPRAGSTESERLARLALVALAVIEGLLAYPVASAQVRWSSLLMVPVGTLCVHDGVRQLRSETEVATRHGLRVATGLLASAILLASVGWFASVLVDDQSSEIGIYNAYRPLSLPGSDLIHVPSGQAGSLESLAKAIRAQCSTFLTMPALNSLYFWTGEWPPTTWYNMWFFTLDTPQQAQVIRLIKGPDRSRFCVVDNPRWSAFWAQGHVVPQLPLARLVERFRKEHDPPQIFDGYRLFVSSGAAS